MRLHAVAVLILALAFGPVPLRAAPATGEPVPIDRIVAVVNDGVVLESELETFLAGVKAQLRERVSELPSEDVLRRQALERLIMQKLQVQTAEQTGVRVDDETLNQAVRNIAQRNNMTLDQFRQALEADGYTFAQFRENIREEILVARLQRRQVDERIQVNEHEVERFLATEGGASGKSYRLRHILVALPEAASPEQIQAAQAKIERIRAELARGADFRQLAIAMSDGQQALEGGELGWFPAGEVPALFADVVTDMEPGAASGVLRSPSGFHLVQLVETRGAESHTVRQTHVRHILLRTNEVMTDDVARQRLEQLRQRIVGGDDFATLARAHSEDTMSARKGGDLGWVGPGETVPRFERAMAELRPGELSQPVQSRFGWHLIEVLERREYDDTAEYQRAQAREQIRARKRQENLELWLRRLRDEAYIEYRLES